MKQKNSSGFTLMELLVVIAVIGLLASIVLVAVSISRSKARDVRRKADLAQIQKALEFYYDKYGGYPTSAWGNGVAADYTIYQSLDKQPNFAQFMATSHDPEYPNVDCYNTEYVYISNSFRDPATLATKYVLYTTLEDQSTTNLNTGTSSTDNSMVNVWPCAGYGIPNYRLTLTGYN